MASLRTAVQGTQEAEQKHADQHLAMNAQEMVGEPTAGVRCAALRSLARVLATVSAVAPSDAKMFNE